mmetsp:Transcript_82776/g.208393  ORF Transcript_82776/g.208393 Transcript_82776/m.208393 type:complete len:340 (+) Transcript_82776:98-1117(+)
MGAHASCFDGLGAWSQSKGNHPQLSDHYALGDKLGDGAFSIVWSCTNKASSQEHAVKRVFTSHSDLDSIYQEVDMLRKLAHPSVVTLHGVYANKRFVDMVFSLYCGGDLVEGAQLYWNSKGLIPMIVLQNLGRQMFRSIEWLHQNNVVHRDVKGDNFLLDHMDLEHPDCRVCLSDFGFAVELKPDERLKELCGTVQYMAPEIHAQSYSLKVDVWAAGVTTYALATRRFPFESEMQARTQVVEIPSRCGETCKKFMLGALSNREAERLSASAALEHPFLAHVATADSSVDGPSQVAQPQVKQFTCSGSSGMQALQQSTSYGSDALTALPSDSSCDMDQLW